jgi:hypothetical protein
MSDWCGGTSSVQVRTIMDLDERCEMVEARLAYDKDPRGFQKAATEESEALTKKLTEARARLSQVKLAPELSLKVCAALGKRAPSLFSTEPARLPRIPPPHSPSPPVLHACRCLRCAHFSTWMACAATLW